MTAVFAMLRGNVLFVAGDTRRGSTVSINVQKVHSWGDGVLLGQSGNGDQQSALIANLKLKRKLVTQRSEADLYPLYQHLRPSHLADVKAPARPNGTLLVAALDGSSSGAALLDYDFATGARTPLTGTVAARGSDVPALTAIADLHMLRLGGGPAFPLDEWAQASVADAVAAFPDDIGWPCDMIVSRPSPAGGRIVTERRIDGTSAVGLPEFSA